MNPFKSLSDAIHLLHIDFIGIVVHPVGVLFFFLHCFIALAVIGIYLLFGQRVRKMFFGKSNEYIVFINIALGYISIGTLLGVLGSLSLFTTPILVIFYILITFLAIFPYHNVPRIQVKSIKMFVKQNIFKKDNALSLLVCFFVLLSFIRLSVPEIEEDTYHTDMPYFYLSQHTMMLETRDPLHVIPYPQLAEMTYLFPMFIQQKDSARFIHFAFYLLIVLLLVDFVKKKENESTKLAPLLFVTAPVVMRYARAQYIDFFMVFCFLLSVLLLRKKSSQQQIILSGLIFGGALATKMWVLVYLPAILFYIYLLNRNASALKKVFTYMLLAISVAGFWYIRSYLLTGYPLYPIFAKITDFDSGRVVNGFTTGVFGFNNTMFESANLVVLSPLFFLGILFAVVTIQSLIRKSIRIRIPLFIFIFFMTVIQLTVKIGYGRYLLVWFTCAIIPIAAGVRFGIKQNYFARYFFMTAVLLVSIYYVISSSLLLPYGFGWADQNKFLTRIEERNNSSYYDFDRLFRKHIATSDLVGMYGIEYYYYAGFPYIDARYAFNKENRTFDELHTAHITKLFVKDADIEGFCKKLQLQKCEPHKTKLLASYKPNNSKVYNLYALQW